MKKGWQTKTLGEVLEKTETINPLQSPNSEFDYIDVSSVSNTTFEIRLIASDGRSIQMVKTKEKLTAIPINNVPAGRYYVKITGKNYNQTETVIISR